MTALKTTANKPTFDLFIKWAGLHWRWHLRLHRNITGGCQKKTRMVRLHSHFIHSDKPVSWVITLKRFRYYGCQSIGGNVVQKCFPVKNRQFNTSYSWGENHFCEINFFSFYLIVNHNRTCFFTATRLRGLPGHLECFVNKELIIRGLDAILRDAPG